MTIKMFDAAYRPDLAAVKAAGGIAMSVYLTGQYASTCASPAQLHTAGLGALGNFEEAANLLTTCGRAGGLDIGRRAAAAYAAEGAPTGQGLGIAFSLDVRTAASQFPAVGDAFAGIAAGMGDRFVPLVYGEGAAIDYLAAHHNVPGVEWLAAPTSWPGFNDNDPRVAVVQRVGSPVRGTDEDDITNLTALAPYIWWPPGSPYAPEAPVTPNDIAAITNAVWTREHKTAAGVSYSLESYLVAADGYAHDNAAALRTANAALAAVTKQLADLAQQVAALEAKITEVTTPGGTVNVSGTLTVGAKS